MTVSIDELANDDLFPGNMAAIEQLIAENVVNSFLGFIGSGASVPLSPSWQQLLLEFTNKGISRGLITEAEIPDLKDLIKSDPLEAANIIESCLTTQTFRNDLGEIFDLQGKFTIAHEKIIGLKLDGLITTNYDGGLSAAYTHATRKMPKVLQPDDVYEVSKWLHNQIEISQMPILHWHGTAASPDRAVLTADDYHRFYSQASHRTLLEEIWRTKRLLIIGFGFYDPYLTRIAEDILRKMQIPNRHFALVGSKNGVSSLLRRTFSNKFRVTPIFYKIFESDDGGQDHSALQGLLSLLRDETRSSDEPVATEAHSASALALISDVDRARREFEAGLFTSNSGSLLYVEPTLIQRSLAEENEFDPEDDEISVANIVASNSNFLIVCRYEYGGTTLALRLKYEMLAAGHAASVFSANNLPNYPAKLRKIPDFDADYPRQTIILDNVNLEGDERLLKEIYGLRPQDRLIVLAKAHTASGSGLSSPTLPFEARVLVLDSINRVGLRVLARQLFDSHDSDLITSAVEKTYQDLLELCIPLTPTNVIMYLTVIRDRGDFSALNRLQIMETYIRGILERPSDFYRSSFNVDHKIDILSGFVFWLYERGKTSFTRADWNTFSNDEMRRSLSNFDAEGLFSDLSSSKFIHQYYGNFRFKYKHFYAYFLGQYINSRGELVKRFIGGGHHITIDGLVEVLAGLGRDNTDLVRDLISRLKEANDAFYATYKVSELDPYSEVTWITPEFEESELWEPVTKSLADGPASDEEVDRLRRSIVAEQRTEDQAVVIREFSKLEQSATFNQELLIDALRESRGLNGDIKLEAITEVNRTYRMVMQIGFLFAPIIASRRFFVWNNVAFTNSIVYDDRVADDREAQTGMVIAAIPSAVSDRSSQRTGSVAMGDLLKARADKCSGGDFETYLIYRSLIAAKPELWQKTAEAIIRRIPYDALYLRYILGATVSQFRSGVNTNHDRTSLKRLVGLIQAKREFQRDEPSNKMVGRIVEVIKDETLENNADDVG